MRTFLVGILPLSVKTFFLGAPTFPRALTASLTRRPANEIKEGFRELAERPAYSLPQRVLEVFQLVDADGSGQLDEAELGDLKPVCTTWTAPLSFENPTKPVPAE